MTVSHIFCSDFSHQQYRSIGTAGPHNRAAYSTMSNYEDGRLEWQKDWNIWLYSKYLTEDREPIIAPILDLKIDPELLLDVCMFCCFKSSYLMRNVENRMIFTGCCLAIPFSPDFLIGFLCLNTAPHCNTHYTEWQLKVTDWGSVEFHYIREVLSCFILISCPSILDFLD